MIIQRVLPFLFILSFSWLGYANENKENKTKLLPEVKSLLTLAPFDEAWLEDNIYTDFTVLKYGGEDYRTVGKEIIRQNYNAFKTWLESDKTIAEDEYSASVLDFPAQTSLPEINHNANGWRNIISISQQRSYDLFEEIIKDNSERPFENDKESVYNTNIDANYKRNQTLIKRHHALLSSGSRFQMIPNYSTSATAKLFLYFVEQDPNVNEYYRLSNLLLAKGLLNIIAGYTKEGLDLIEYEYDLALKVVEGADDINYASSYVQQLDIIYFIVNYLLHSGSVDKVLDHPLFTKITMPLFYDNDENSPYKTVRYNQLKAMFKENIQHHYLLLIKDNYRVDGISYPWGFYNIKKIDKIATINLLYLYYEMILENHQKGESLSTESARYQAALALWKSNNQTAEIGDISDIYAADTALTERLTTVVLDAYIYKNILNYYRSVVNNQKLVTIKLKAKEQNIAPEAIPDYLVTLGELNQDVITHLPFIYDSKLNTLTASYYQLYFLRYLKVDDIDPISVKLGTKKK